MHFDTIDYAVRVTFDHIEKKTLKLFVHQSQKLILINYYYSFIDRFDNNRQIISKKNKNDKVSFVIRISVVQMAYVERARRNRKNRRRRAAENKLNRN